MNVSVRYIPTDRSMSKDSNGLPREIWSGNKPAICFIGKKEAHCIINDDFFVRPVTLPTKIVLGSREIEYHGAAYPVSRFVDRLQASEKPFTSSALQLIASLTGGKLPKEVPKISDETPTRRSIVASSGPTLIARLAEEMKIPQPKLRRFLRQQGLKAPYDDETKLRKTLKKYENKK